MYIFISHKKEGVIVDFAVEVSRIFLLLLPRRARHGQCLVPVSSKNIILVRSKQRD